MVGRSIRALASFAVVAVIATTAGCDLASDLQLPVGVVYPSITPDSAASGTQTVTHTFRFEGHDRTVTVDVDEALYRGATAASKTVLRFGDARADDWIEDYYPAFIWEEHQDEFFSALIAEFRTIRDSEGLGPDRYAELLTVFAQSLEYRTDPIDLEPKFPVETFVEKAGDCDDKALLLAGLLSREGYDVALMLFEAEQHVSLGLKTTGPDYRDTGYAYVETTAPGFIGMVPDELEGGITLTSVPQVFSVDGGTSVFGAGHEVAAILDARTETFTRIESLAGEIEDIDDELQALETRVTAESNRIDGLRAAGRTTEYNAALSGYNALVGQFNELAARRNAHADTYNRWVELQHYIAETLDDRPAVYRRVTSIGW